jgi:sulfatase-like protein
MSVITVGEDRETEAKLRQRPKAMTAVAAVLTLGLIAGGPSAAVTAQETKPNILFIMGDDIGWMQVGVYHHGIGIGETPNIDRLAKEGGMFDTYYAMQSCTSGRNVFFYGDVPSADGDDPTAASGQPVLFETRHPGDCQVPARSRVHHR